jgi:sodium-dependent dicarboxylate transporter 2/3/5
MKEEKDTRNKLQNISLLVGILIFFLLIFLDIKPDEPNVKKMAAIAMLMSIWWIFESVPIATTALLPLILIPLLGIAPVKTIASTYMSSTLFLFIGGFIIAIAMENWNLHRRIAINTLLLFGGKPNSIILGFMVTTAFLSMWISNTATVLMMLPIALSIINKLEEQFDYHKVKNFSISLLISIAYSASIGGLATLVGTPSNLIFVRILQVSFPNSPDISFAKWFIFGLPLSIIMLIATWFTLTKIIFKIDKDVKIDNSLIIEEKNKMLKISYEEIVISFTFIITALLWIFRDNINIGILNIPGWSNILEKKDFIDDGVIAIFMAILLFIIPTKDKRKSIVSSDVFERMPWGIIILFGGGFALAEGFTISGLSTFLGNKIAEFGNLDTFLLVVIVTTFLIFLTELTSNMATTQAILPILASISIAMKINPLLLMIPATIAASCAFMLPVATAPNAIVFGSERLRIAHMAKSGFIINIICILIISIFCYFFLPIIFDINYLEFPEWAKK